MTPSTYEEPEHYWLVKFLTDDHTDFFEEHYVECNDYKPLSKFAGSQFVLSVDHDFMAMGEMKFEGDENRKKHLIAGPFLAAIEALDQVMTDFDKDTFTHVLWLRADEIDKPLDYEDDTIILKFLTTYPAIS